MSEHIISKNLKKQKFLKKGYNIFSSLKRTNYIIQGEIMRLNSDTKFIREISEEEEKNNAIKNLLKIKTPIKTIAIATNLTEEEVKERIKKFNLEG